MIKIDFGRLPSSPLVAVRLLEYTRDVNFGRYGLADIISMDPVIVARMLKMANSAQYAKQGQIIDISKAISRLGTSAASISALSFSTPHQISEAGIFPFKLYWQHSIAMAVACRLLSDIVNYPNTQVAYLCGLLARMGQVMMAASSPDEYDKVIVSADGQLPNAELEAQFLGCDFHQIGSAVLADWELPDVIYQAIGVYGASETMKESYNSEVQLLCRVMLMADKVAASFLEANHSDLQPQFQVLADFGFTREDRDRFSSQFRQAILKMEPWLNVELLDTEQHLQIVLEAQKRTTIIAAQTHIRFDETSSLYNSLKNEYQDLKVETESLPHLARKFQQTSTAVAWNISFAVVAAGGVCTTIFFFVYMVKSLLGIDLLKNLHLEDLLF